MAIRLRLSAIDFLKAEVFPSSHGVRLRLMASLIASDGLPHQVCPSSHGVRLRLMASLIASDDA